jgi:ribokinase
MAERPDSTSTSNQRNAGQSSQPSIVVVGSLNMDLVIPVKHHPAVGETVLGGDFRAHPGGKGANQAVACARFGSPKVRMIGRLGRDSAGEQLRAALEAEGIETRYLKSLDAPTGTAFISLDSQGQNTIIVSMGANARLRPEDLQPEQFVGASVVLLQLEVPLEVVARAAELGHAAGAKVVLNVAPAQKLPPALLAHVHTLVLNEVEAAMLSGLAVPHSPEAALIVALELTRLVPEVVITLGDAGAVLAGHEVNLAQPSFAVKVLDTTAAGDAFIGALAVAKAEGLTPIMMLRLACAAGALATTKAGAQPSLPKRQAALELMA